jgi:uncharacterized membrane protein
MNMNIKVRVRNPWFWVGVVSVAITAIGVDPQTFTSWAAVWEGIKAVLSNPVQLVTMCLAGTTLAISRRVFCLAIANLVVALKARLL